MGNILSACLGPDQRLSGQCWLVQVVFLWEVRHCFYKLKVL